jgi:hypothetical protein
VRKAFFAALVLCLLPLTASAVPVLWTFSGATFSDGGTASGSFVYDADTNTYSSVNITTTAGSVLLTGANLLYVAPGLPASSADVLTVASGAANLTGVRGFALSFSPALSDLGGTVSLTGLEATCADATCSAPSGASRSLNAGVASGVGRSNVPALSPWAMAVTALLLAAAALVALRRSV